MTLRAERVMSKRGRDSAARGSEFKGVIGDDSMERILAQHL
jgi:hypothetical protein